MNRLSMPGIHAHQAEATFQPPSLEAIFSSYFDPVFRFILSRVGNREDAEDLTSEVFLKAARYLDSGRAEASIADWLFTVARTVLTDHWRRYYRRGAMTPLDEERTEALADPGPAPDSEGSAQAVAKVLMLLPDRYRRVLELRFLQGYTIVEAARAMDVTPGNVKVLQHRALARAVHLSETLPDLLDRAG